MMSSPLLFLEPPYQMASRLHHRTPDLGSVALLDAVPERPTTSAIKEQLDAAPWCPLCILADSDSGMRSTRRLARTCVVFGLEEDGGGAILRAVGSRPRPTVTDMVDWLTRRTRLATIARTLAELLARPPLRRVEVSHLPYSVREQLRQLGEWGAIEWQRAAVLAELAADRSTLNRIVAGNDSLSDESRRWMHDLLGVSEREFHQRHGWEWVLEASLRRSGFFERAGQGERAVRALRAYRVVAPFAGVAEERAEGRRATA